MQARTAPMPASGPQDLPALLQGLGRLRRDQRCAWRCLRTLREVRDFAHLARRLHLNQAQLQQCLQDLARHLGPQHLQQQQGRICLSEQLLGALQALDPSPTQE